MRAPKVMRLLGLGMLAVAALALPHDATAADWCEGGVCQEWEARYDNGGASTLAVDSLGNVYVTGYSTGSGTGYDYATIKYDSDGNEQWVARYDGPANENDKAFALAVDGLGNVYVDRKSVVSGQRVYSG